nr:hypothetical protein [uncultured Allomuricauda sp.]
MKKTIYSLALLAALSFMGCSSDDDNGGEENSRTCDILNLVPATFVDNGDGTATVTFDGESQTFDLEGVDFDTFTDQICSGDLELDFNL